MDRGSAIPRSSDLVSGREALMGVDFRAARLGISTDRTIGVFVFSPAHTTKSVTRLRSRALQPEYPENALQLTESPRPFFFSTVISKKNPSFSSKLLFSSTENFSFVHHLLKSTRALTTPSDRFFSHEFNFKPVIITSSF